MPSTTTTPRRRRRNDEEQKNNNKNSNNDGKVITESLERTQNLLRHELDRMHHVSEAIDADGKRLESTKNKQQSMNDTVKGANAALRNLKLQKRKEFLVLMASVVLFYSVALYILWSRLAQFPPRIKLFW